MFLKKLIRIKSKKILFTTPSHSQKMSLFHKFRQFYKYDISETETHSPDVMLRKAEEYAARIYNVKKTKFLINGSTSGILTSVLAVAHKDDNILVWEKAHKCHHNAIKLAGANPIYYNLPTNEFGVAYHYYDKLEEYFIKNKIKALIVVSPTYEGYVADIKKLKDLCNKYNAYLIVDEAHGALYPFSEELPESAINYADFIVQSLHKTAGGLNPTALLHCNCEDINIDAALSLINTTSPSYPLLMTIEKNIRYLNSKQGKKELKNLINNLKELRKLNNIEFGGNDITKILIKKDGLTGYQLSDFLFNNGIEDEITNNVSTMLLTGIGTKKNKLDKLKLVLKKL